MYQLYILQLNTLKLYFNVFNTILMYYANYYFYFANYLNNLQNKKKMVIMFFITSELL